MTSSLPHPARRPDIDGLRALAVLPVAVFHAQPHLARWGFVGVDVFFVISGYLITLILLEGLETGRFSFREFYSRRARRIFPALAVVLAATFIAGLVVLLPREMALLGAHVAAGGGFVANLLLWSEAGYFDWSSATKPLVHLWSLGVEEQFYIAWPMVLWLLGRRPRALAIACFALPLASFGWNAFVARSDAVADFYSPLCRVWEILAGGSLAWIALHRPAWLSRGAQARSLLGVAALAVAVAFIDETRAFPGAWALAPVAGAWLLVSAGPRAWINRVVLGNPALVAIGLVSYPFYLWHWPILVFARLSTGAALESYIAWTCLAAALVLAAITYRWIERPLRFGGRGPAKALALGAAMAILVVAGLVAAWQDGFPRRVPAIVPADVRPFLDAPFDFRAAWRSSTCFLDPEQGRDAFDECPDRYGHPGLLLWGDSHAAHLYPGIAGRYGAKYQIVERTASSCPPLLDTDIPNRPLCRGINERVIEEVERHRPEVAVLSARWFTPGYYKWDGLERAMERLRAAGVKRIVLVGPSPIWRHRLQRELYLAYLRDRSQGLPSRLADATYPIHTQVGPQLEALAGAHGVLYVDSERLLCDATGCLARAGDGPGGVLFWDEGHYTPAGSRFLASHLPIPEDPATLR